MSEDLILVLNAGSATMKFGVYAVLSKGPVERARGAIEEEHGHLLIRAGTPEGELLGVPQLVGDALDHLHGSGFAPLLLEWLDGAFPASRLIGAGHRVVHGGERYRRSMAITPPVHAEMVRLGAYAPLHQPASLAAINDLERLRPDVLQVACFDTAFHLSQDRLARLYALPARYESEGIRRFGFHGLSFRYVAQFLQRRLGSIRGRTVVAHLGGGASICGLVDGASAASSMGLTPLDGLPMATRCGSIDPGAVLVMLDDPAMTPRQLRDLLYQQSGLLGVSGISGDMRVLLASPEASAAEAVALFVRRAAREIAAIACEIGGMDTLVFTGGIGEHAAQVRQRIGDALSWLGLRISAKANRAESIDDGLCIAAPDSAIACWVVATNEGSIIADDTFELLDAEKAMPGASETG